MRSVGYHLFDTALGTCGIAWTDKGVCGASLPERAAGETRARLLRRFPGARERLPTAMITETIDGVVRLLNGEPVDLTHVAIDDDGISEFNRKVRELTRRIPAGSTRTYGELARDLGDPLLAQQVGQALGSNPIPIIIPCHRILAANGKLGGFSAPGGSDTKRRLLLIERALPDEPLDLFE